GSMQHDCGAHTIGFSATGTMAPYAHVDAFLQASLGFSGVLEAGVRGTLTLARVDLPLTMNASITGNLSSGMFFNGGSNLDLKMSTFGGKLVVFLDSLVGSVEQS